MEEPSYGRCVDVDETQCRGATLNMPYSYWMNEMALFFLLGASRSRCKWVGSRIVSTLLDGHNIARKPAWLGPQLLWSNNSVGIDMGRPKFYIIHTHRKKKEEKKTKAFLHAHWSTCRLVTWCNNWNWGRRLSSPRRHSPPDSSPVTLLLGKITIKKKHKILEEPGDTCCCTIPCWGSLKIESRNSHCFC